MRNGKELQRRNENTSQNTTEIIQPVHVRNLLISRGSEMGLSENRTSDLSIGEST
jgi:hypothetical protein